MKLTRHQVSVVSHTETPQKIFRFMHEFFNVQFAVTRIEGGIKVFHPELDYTGKIYPANPRPKLSYPIYMPANGFEDGRYWFSQECEDWIEIYHENKVEICE